MATRPPASSASATAGSRSSSRVARSRGSAATRRTPARRATPATRRCGSTTTRTAAHRLTSPLRRRPDGSYEEIDWDTAIAEVAAGFQRIRDEHGGESIFYYGGGGQGNHLGGAYSGAFLRALGSSYRSSALAQEKTGEAWVDAQLYGGHTRGEFEHAEVAVFVGKNPWMSQSFPRARVVLREIAKDPERVDDRDRPGRDRHRQAGRLPPARAAGHATPGAWRRWSASIVQEDLVDDGVPRRARDRRRAGARPRSREVAGRRLRRALRGRRGPDPRRRAADRRRGERRRCSRTSASSRARTARCARTSTSCCGSSPATSASRAAMHLHSWIVHLFRDRPIRRARRSPGARIIGGLVPCNVIPDEILTDHPNRFRAMIVESSQPGALARRLAALPRGVRGARPASS